MRLIMDCHAHAQALSLSTRSQATVRKGRGPLAALLRTGGLYPVFQPIVSLSDGAIYSHEALIRGPSGAALEMPDRLLGAAAAEGLKNEFENACVGIALAHWGALLEPGRLFVNMSAKALVQIISHSGCEAVIELIGDFGVLPRLLTLEITEYERVADMDQLASVVREIRAAGVSLALDDFGDGRSSLRLWSQLKPEVVKIDKYFTKDISQHADKLKTIQALQQIAAIFDTALVAEGIETEDDLRVLRDLGIAYGQGYFLGRPAPSPRQHTEPEALEVMRNRRIAVFPELRRPSNVGILSHLAVVKAPSVGLTCTNDELANLFLRHPTLHAAAVVAEGARPVGIINRSVFMNEYSKLYYREIWGRRPCLVHANLEPRLIERNHNVDELIGILTSDDQRYLTDGLSSPTTGVTKAWAPASNCCAR